MAPRIALIIGTGLGRLLGLLGIDTFGTWPAALRIGLALMFLLTGVAHFGLGRRDGLIAMVPPRLPRPDLLVTITGILELVGAAGLLVPATYRAAAACLALLLVVMFPANIYAARAHVLVAGKAETPIPQRTALQIIFLAAALIVALA